MKEQKIFITIEDGIDAATAVKHVAEVVSKGRVSKNGTMYCYATLFADLINVYAIDYRKYDCFRVNREKHIRQF